MKQTAVEWLESNLPKTFKELFSGTGIEPTTDESGNTNYNFKATMKEQSKQQTAVEFLESNLPTAFKDLTINKQLIEQAKEMEKQQERSYSEEDMVRYALYLYDAEYHLTPK